MTGSASSIPPPLEAGRHRGDGWERLAGGRARGTVGPPAGTFGEEVIRLFAIAGGVGEGHLAGHRAADLAEPLEQAETPAGTQRGETDGLLLALAQPALVGGAGGAQLADDPPSSVGEEHVRLLAPEEPASADIALDIRL